jgi:CubicO group peptidase (beta-lactamase class C family)
MYKDAIFRIASHSKANTVIAAMMLWEQGKFQLDDPISTYINEFANPQILNQFRYNVTTYTIKAAAQEITIQRLLTHTSGIGYGIIDADLLFKMIYHKAGITDLFTTEPVTIKEGILKFAKLPLPHEGVEKYIYSEGIDVPGSLVEVISGMPFDQYLRTHLFEPLGMDDIYFYLPQSKAGRLVAMQRRLEHQWQQYPGTFLDTDCSIT